MKKLLNESRSNKPLLKFDLKMKLSALLIFAAIFAIQANSIYSQRTKITMDLNNVSVLEVIDEIETLTEFRFVYKVDDVDLNRLISVNANKKNISDLLQQMFIGTETVFNINDRLVYLLQKRGDQIKSKAVNPTQPKTEQLNVNGQVLDESGTPLPGANIIEKGTTNGTQTDFDGNYTITLQNDNSVLVFSYVGYQTQEISVNNRTKIDIQLQPDTEKLDEVVVIGYGIQEQAKISGSIGKVSVDELQDFPVSNFDQALAGRIAGVQILQTTGEPGRELDIRVRGIGSITAGVDPLYVVDGVPLDNAGQVTEVVNLEDIESIQVLKDASSAAIYGSRGGNGVVLINTKKGKEQKMKVNFNHSTGFQSVSKKMDIMNAYEYAELSRDGHNASYLQDVPTGSADDPNDVRPQGFHRIPPELFPYLEGVEGLTDTDWQDEVFRSAIIQRYNLSVSGGNEKWSYFVSGIHSFQEGVIINSDYQKTGLRANIGLSSGKFNIGLNLSPSYTSENRVSANDPWFADGIVSAALSYSPTWPVYNPDGSFNYQGNGFWRIGTDFQHNEIVNPVALATLPENVIEHYNLLGNFFVEYEVIPDLKAKSSFAVNFNAYQNEFYRPAELETRRAQNFGRPSNPSARLSNTNIYNWILENTLNYNKRFGNHSLDILGGMTAQRDKRVVNRTVASVTSDTPVQNAIQVINADQLSDSDSGIQEWSLYSLLGRVQYDYKSKYLLSATFRADASSRFGANNKWGYFPSISGAWRMSEESFLSDSKLVNELKLRASFGLTGNFQIGNYEQVSAITRDNYITGNPGQLENGLRPSQVANPDLSWEKTEMFNAGLDIELFQRQLGLTVDYYNGNTSDLLLQVPIPQTTGFDTALQNIGEVNNQGFEVTLNVSPDMGAFKWSGNYNISVNRNEVKALGPENTDIITTAGTGTAFFLTRVGEAIGSYYVLIQDGIFATEEQLSQYPSFGNTQVGDFRFVDVDGNGVINVNEDRAIVGNYAPDFIYGFSNTFRYKGFDLNVAFQGSYGGEILNLHRRFTANGEGNFNNTRELLNRWRSEQNPGDLNTNRANRKASGNNGRTSTWHIEDGSYLRLQNVSLGYSLPSSILDELGIDKLRFFITGNNIYTWTDYTGFNPEVNLAGGGNQLTPGLDYGVYPLATTYSFGINLSF